MRFRDFIKFQSKCCLDSNIRDVWIYMYNKFNTYVSVEESKKIYDKVLEKYKEDNIDYKKIWILHFYNSTELKERGLTDADNVETGYKSAISDDIISDNGDEYIYLGKSPYYKFYLLKDVYYVRTIGETALNRVTEFNYDSYADYIEYLECK